MRYALAIAVACLVAACGLGVQSNGEVAFVGGGAAARSARAMLDAQAIMQGMEQARIANETMARVSTPAQGIAPASVTR